jgi:hypothetical protein
MERRTEATSVRGWTAVQDATEAILDILSPAEVPTICSCVTDQGKEKQKSHPADPSQPRKLCKITDHGFKFEVVC